MTTEQALAIIEEKRTWSDLISGEKDELYDAIDVILADHATLRTRLDALVKAAEKVRDIWQNEGMYEGFDESVHALASVVSQVKGVEG